MPKLLLNEEVVADIPDEGGFCPLESGDWIEIKVVRPNPDGPVVAVVVSGGPFGLGSERTIGIHRKYGSGKQQISKTKTLEVRLQTARDRKPNWAHYVKQTVLGARYLDGHQTKSTVWVPCPVCARFSAPNLAPKH